ncbi:GNAT family N-acetyltransferase [Tundrisphaera lichenicola]|uniref:GNAT family N-acetyltransferase n=1 Tax=Tundrisphaera lichenicola TaxID=2029860 RepID=UPI003EBE6790
MLPLGPDVTDWLPDRADAPHRTVALRHAAIHNRPGLMGDDPARPSSLVWLREGDDGQWEAFGAGRPEPSLSWLIRQTEGRTISLMAPPSWEGPIREGAERWDRAIVQTWLRPDSPIIKAGPVRVRRLGLIDASAFEGLAPPWALRSWGDFPSMIGRGVAFGIEGSGTIVAVAWTYESDDRFDKIGVATAPQFRRLGLGRAVSSMLVEHILGDRAKQPLWTTHDGNLASVALARSIGFSEPVAETLFRWTPR